MTSYHDCYALGSRLVSRPAGAPVHASTAFAGLRGDVMSGRRTIWQRQACRFLVLSSVLLTGACNAFRNERDLSTDVFGKISSVDLSARTPLPSKGAVSTTDGPAPKPAVYYGSDNDPTGTTANPKTAALDANSGAVPTAEGDSYELNFENAPLAAVVKAVLGDILGVGFLIDPRIQGNISLSSGRPVPKKQILFALENALRLNNAALVRDAGGYRIIPAGEAMGLVGVDPSRRSEPGFGLSVLPLRYVSAANMVKLIDSFAARPGAIRADATRNLLLFTGTGSERQTAMETALAFDTDWMRGQSVGVYPVRNAAPETIIAELENVMQSSENGAAQNLVKFQPVERLNAVLVVAYKPNLLTTAASWINRLDHADMGANGIKVYRVQYGDAKQIADLLNDAFAGKSNSSDSSTGQVAPGAGVQLARNDETNAAPAAGAAAPSSNSPFGAIPAAARQNGTGKQDDSRLGSPGPSGSPGQGPLPNVRVTADTVNNSLLIFANRENYRIIERTLRELDRPRLQVAIEATIAEVTLNDSLQYGVQYFLQSKDIGLKRNRGSVGLTAGDLANGVIGRVVPGANLILGSETDPRVVLDALRTYTDVKVVSSPAVVVLDNQVATLQVGDSVPVATSEATLVSGSTSTSASSASLPVANTIDYRNTGVILRVLPRINANGNVGLDIEQEISNVVPNANATTLTPTVSERKVKSSIAVASGQTVMLGGLISENQNNSRSGVPVLERIQLLGDLFSENGTNNEKTELIIFIRPRIIRDGIDAQAVAEELRDKILSSSGVPPPPPIVRKY